MYTVSVSLTTCTSNYLICRDFKMEDGRAEIPLNITVQGDVLIVIYHSRSTLGGRLQAKVRHTVTDIYAYCPGTCL